MQVTVCIPVAPYHTELMHRAADSARHQTVGCVVQMLVDYGGRGAGWARNRLLERVDTPFVVFLDADDWLEPDFVERCQAAWQPGRYVYTDWLEDDDYYAAPDCPWTNQTAHVVTTLLPTETVWAADGFDESLPGAEDTDLYVKLNVNGVCGIALHAPLFHYSGDGRRGRAFRFGADYDPVMQEIKRRYGHLPMGCCGDDVPKSPDGRQPNDVLAVALWHGNRSEYSALTGRKYPRATFGRQVWIDPRDAAARPNLWRVVQRVDPTPAVVNADDTAALIGAMEWRTQPPSMNVTPAPDVRRLTRLARKVLTPAPVFVVPETHYESYADFWTLVSLAGFDIRQMRDIDLLDESAVYIFVTPEPLPDVSDAKARCIAWLFEYAGDYVQDVSRWRGELWASDKAYADAIGARFVLLGSDARLRLATPPLAEPPEFDVTMLGYLTPRRQAVKAELAHLRWAEPDYPGHGVKRHQMLENTRAVLHTHQHDAAPYAAPLRYAVAAAYGKPVISEALADDSPYAGLMQFVGTDTLHFHNDVDDALKRADGADLRHHLCVLHPFADNVMEALHDER